jgi:predicted deacylase
LNLDAPGRNFGSVILTHSDDAHAFDCLPIPIACLSNGEGPTLLLTAGNHGDEYEGQVILHRLAREMPLEALKGRLIILPALNYPAVRAGRRTSPLDKGNLNRAFPGEAKAGPTARIAQFVTGSLLPLCNAGIDFHSGGTTARYLPLTYLCTYREPAAFAASLELAEAFALPFTYLVEGRSARDGFDPHAHDAGLAFISCELAGAGSFDRKVFNLGWQGLLRVMDHLGMLGPGAADWQSPESPAETRYLLAHRHSDPVMSPATGLLELARVLGDRVAAGDTAGWVHDLEEPAQAPREVLFERDGIIMAQRHTARVQRGSYLYLLAREVERAGALRWVEKAP